MAYITTPDLGLELADPTTIQAFETTNVNSNFLLLEAGIVADRVRLTAAEGDITALEAQGAIRGTGTVWASSFAALDASSTTALGDVFLATASYTGIERHHWTRNSNGPIWAPTGMIFATTKADMDAYIAVVAATTRFRFSVGALWFDSGTGTYYRFTSATGAYRTLQGSVPIIPTVTGTGGTSAVDSGTGEVTFSGAVTALRVNSTTAILSTFRYVEAILRYDGSTAGSHILQMTSGSSINSGASTYRQSNVSDGVPAAPAATTSFSQGYVGNRKKRRRNIELSNLADALPTMAYETGVDGDGAATPVNVTSGGEHNVSTAYDGIVFTFTGMGTISNGSLQLIGHY